MIRPQKQRVEMKVQALYSKVAKKLNLKTDEVEKIYDFYLASMGTAVRENPRALVFLSGMGVFRVDPYKMMTNLRFILREMIESTLITPRFELLEVTAEQVVKSLELLKEAGEYEKFHSEFKKLDETTELLRYLQFRLKRIFIPELCENLLILKNHESNIRKIANCI